MHSAHPAATELRSQLASLHVPLDRTTRVALRARVSRYVDETKRLGWTPQRVIVAVKQIAYDAGLSASPRVVGAPPAHAMTPTDRLLVDMVGWCIDRYYDAE
jgi:hypothetical protein